MSLPASNYEWLINTLFQSLVATAQNQQQSQTQSSSTQAQQPQVYAAPQSFANYVYDPNTGYYYDSSTGLYYDANTQVLQYLIIARLNNIERSIIKIHCRACLLSNSLLCKSSVILCSTFLKINTVKFVSLFSAPDFI